MRFVCVIFVWLLATLPVQAAETVEWTYALEAGAAAPTLFSNAEKPTGLIIASGSKVVRLGDRNRGQTVVDFGVDLPDRIRRIAFVSVALSLRVVVSSSIARRPWIASMSTALDAYSSCEPDGRPRASRVSAPISG